MLKWRSFFILLAGFCAQLVFEGLVLSFDIFLPYLMKYFHSTNAKVTLSASAIQGPAQLLGPISSWLTDRFGGRKLVIFCGLASALGFLLGSLCAEIWQLILATSVIGVSVGLASVPIVTATCYYFGDRYRNVFTALATTGGAAGAVGFPFFLQFFLDTSPWQYVFVITGGVCLQVVVCGALFEPHANPEEASVDIELTDVNKDETYSDEQPYKLSLSCQTPLMMYCFLASCFTWSISCYMFDILPLRLDHEGFSGTDIALLLTLQALGYIPGRVLAAALVAWRRLDKAFVFSLTLLLQGLAILMTVWHLQTLGSYTFYVLMIGICYGTTTALIPSVLVDLVGLQKLNHAYGLQLFVEGISGLLGAPLAGWIADTQSFAGAYIVAGIIGVCSAFFLLPYHWPFRKLLSPVAAILLADEAPKCNSDLSL